VFCNLGFVLFIYLFHTIFHPVRSRKIIFLPSAQGIDAMRRLPCSYYQAQLIFLLFRLRCRLSKSIGRGNFPGVIIIRQERTVWNRSRKGIINSIIVFRPGALETKVEYRDSGRLRHWHLSRQASFSIRLFDQRN